MAPCLPSPSSVPSSDRAHVRFSRVLLLQLDHKLCVVGRCGPQSARRCVWFDKMCSCGSARPTLVVSRCRGRCFRGRQPCFKGAVAHSNGRQHQLSHGFCERLTVSSVIKSSRIRYPPLAYAYFLPGTRFHANWSCRCRGPSVQNLHVAGVSVAVIHDKRIDWSKGYRVARLGGPPVSASILFGTASMSKPVTAMAVLRLVQEGKIDLDVEMRNLKQNVNLRSVCRSFKRAILSELSHEFVRHACVARLGSCFIFTGWEYYRNAVPRPKTFKRPDECGEQCKPYHEISVSLFVS